MENAGVGGRRKQSLGMHVYVCAVYWIRSRAACEDSERDNREMEWLLHWSDRTRSVLLADGICVRNVAETEFYEFVFWSAVGCNVFRGGMFIKIYKSIYSATKFWLLK